MPEVPNILSVPDRLTITLDFGLQLHSEDIDPTAELWVMEAYGEIVQVDQHALAAHLIKLPQSAIDQDAGDGYFKYETRSTVVSKGASFGITEILLFLFQSVASGAAWEIFQNVVKSLADQVADAPPRILQEDHARELALRGVQMRRGKGTPKDLTVRRVTRDSPGTYSFDIEAPGGTTYNVHVELQGSLALSRIRRVTYS